MANEGTEKLTDATHDADRRDAEMRAHSDRMPTPEEEAIRDLIRVREDLKEDRRRSIQRLKAFLLRRGLRFPGTSACSGPACSGNFPRRSPPWSGLITQSLLRYSLRSLTFPAFRSISPQTLYS